MKFHLFIIVLSAAIFVQIFASQGDGRHKRSFHSYFDNYFDVIAASTCTALGSGISGWYFPIRRKCVNPGPSCHQICTSANILQQAKSKIDSSRSTTTCVESLHITKGHPSLEDNKHADTDTQKVGMSIFKYQSCSITYCGPNYCCCKFTA